MKLLLLTSLLSLTIAMPTWSGPERRKSLDEAVSEARDRYNGRVLSAETRRRNGRESHKIRILTNDGHVKRLNIDANPNRP